LLRVCDECQRSKGKKHQSNSSPHVILFPATGTECPK
jgi:hypothetical protein